MDAMLARLPKWVSTDSYAINAQAEGNPTKDQMRLMMQSLLADRFKLAVHFETKKGPVLALVPDKPGKRGPKLVPHSSGLSCDVSKPPQPPGSPANSSDVFPAVCDEFQAMPQPNHSILIGSRNVTMAQIAAFLGTVGHLAHTVVDQTGLDGRFDFTLEFNPERKGPPPPQEVQPDDFQVTTIQEALHEQLGLKLKTTNAPVDTLVVDHAERPSEN
jgi:bla regulator protein blaR1